MSCVHSLQADRKEWVFCWQQKCFPFLFLLHFRVMFILCRSCVVIPTMVWSGFPLHNCSALFVGFVFLCQFNTLLEFLCLKLFRSVLNIISLFVLQRPSPRRSNSPDKFKRPTPPPSPNTQTPVQPPPPPPPPPVQPTVQSAASQSATFQHSVHPSSQP